MIRAAIGFVWSAWGGHAALVAGALMALQVHAAYRVPASAFVTLLPWLGVVITVTTILMLTVKLLPKPSRRRVRGVPGRVERRIVWLVGIIVAAVLAAAFTGRISPVAAFFGIGLAAAMVTVVAITAGCIARRCSASGPSCCGPPPCSSTGRWIAHPARSSPRRS